MNPWNCVAPPYSPVSVTSTLATAERFDAWTARVPGTSSQSARSPSRVSATSGIWSCTDGGEKKGTRSMATPARRVRWSFHFPAPASDPYRPPPAARPPSPPPRTPPPRFPFVNPFVRPVPFTSPFVRPFVSPFVRPMPFVSPFVRPLVRPRNPFVSPFVRPRPPFVRPRVPLVRPRVPFVRPRSPLTIPGEVFRSGSENRGFLSGRDVGEGEGGGGAGTGEI